MTESEMIGSIVTEWAAPYVAQDAMKLLELMRPMGEEIAASAKGDPVKIAAALEAGRAAALSTLQ